MSAAAWIQPAAAQLSKVAVEVGGGVTPPVGPLHRRLDTGWNVLAGIGANATDHVSILGEFHFNQFNINDRALAAVSAPDGNVRFWAFTVNPSFHANSHGPADVYVTFGGGVYHRTVEYTTPTVARITVFDPWWGIYYPANVATNQIIGSFGQTKGGVNGGVGFAVRLGQNTNLKAFVEGRYHHIFTRQVESSFIPITVGLRW